MNQCQKKDEERVLERNKMVEAQKPLDDHLYHFYMSMYQITKKCPLIINIMCFKQYSKAEAAYLQIPNSNQQNCYHTQQITYPYTYVNPHIPQTNSSYSSTPLPSPNTSSLSSHHIEHQSYINPLTPLTNSSNSSVSTIPLLSPSNTDDVNLQLASSRNEPTTINRSSYLPVATTPDLFNLLIPLRNYLEIFSPCNTNYLNELC